MASTSNARPTQNDLRLATDKGELNEPEVKENPEDEYIVHRTNYIDSDGVPQVKEHRVLTKDWAAYEKEHGL